MFNSICLGTWKCILIRIKIFSVESKTSFVINYIEDFQIYLQANLEKEFYAKL